MGELVLVCCHAICTDSQNPHHEFNWRLKPFQKSDPATSKPGEHETFLLHIQAGASALRRPDAVLVFSGGRTESDLELSEAESYRDVLARYLDKSDKISRAIANGRILCEDAATDSYQNLLFSLIKYHEFKSSWPQMITIITHGFKETRFLECHAPAIHWPGDKIRVQGISPPFPLAELREVQELESITVEQFRQDPHGTHPPLSTKRATRQWKSNTEVMPGISEVDSLHRLLLWTERATFKEPLPWDAPCR